MADTSHSPGGLIDGDLTEKVIGCAIAVQRELGTGFLERVYGNALGVELAEAGLRAAHQCPVRVRYRQQTVGEYIADVIVEQRLLIELKAARGIDPAHVAQTLHYLKATGLPTGLILNFGEVPLGIKRLRY
jgi:GxxExxY protein